MAAFPDCHSLRIICSGNGSVTRRDAIIWGVTDAPAATSPFEFDAWVDAIFNHDVEGPEWFWGPEFDDLWMAHEPADAVTVSYVARLFRESVCLRRYSHDQVAQGLWFLIGEASPAGIAQALLTSGAPVGNRVDAARSFADFFRDFVAPVAAGPADTDANRFHIACYMWWDIFPSWGGAQSGEPEVHDACLKVMEQTLQLPSELCQLSALHGLNHWHLHHADRTERIIDAFLSRLDHATPRARQYAAVARSGFAM